MGRIKEQFCLEAKALGFAAVCRDSAASPTLKSSAMTRSSEEVNAILAEATDEFSPNTRPKAKLHR